jgi:hypothetical protein
MSRAVWQISGGPASRAYAEVFLWHGVALIGPGDSGSWYRERDDDAFEGGFVRRFGSDGIHYRMYDGARGFGPVAYANLAHLKQPAAGLVARMQRP